MTVRVRPAEPSDEDALIAFLRDLQDAERAIHPSRLPGREVDRFYYDRLRERGADILIAEHDGRPVGLVAGWLDVDDDPLQTPEWRRHGYVSDLFVAGPWRGRGVAQLLLRAIADLLRDRGARRLRIGALCVNDPALAAFRRFGFEPFEVVLDLPLA
ncbi:MAG TPA: GNAT family N-acetyltransferase [Geminicoccaceae bacterium]|nr:GNAT family N-acetyltransferase [Geminicoccaceae bacterium]